MKQITLRIVTLFLCLSMALFTFQGSLDAVAGRFGVQALARHNDAYLEASFRKALISFGVLSGLKAGLDIIEGSEIGGSLGITAQLEVGDIVQPAYDYVDIAWRTLLTGSITLLSIRYLLRAAAILDGYLLGITFVLIALFLALKWWRPDWPNAKGVARDAMSLAIFATLALYYILPLSVWGASRLSIVITRPAIEEAEKGFQNTRDTLFPDNQQQTTDGIMAKLRQLQAHIQQIANYLRNRTMEMVVWTIKLVTGYIFDCIVFPLLLFTLMLWLTRSILRYIFQMNFQSSLRDDLEHILLKRDVKS